MTATDERSHHAFEDEFQATIDADQRIEPRDWMPDAYRKTLADGLWPNLDVLPTAESEATGQAIGETAVTWSNPLHAMERRVQ